MPLLPIDKKIPSIATWHFLAGRAPTSANTLPITVARQRRNEPSVQVNRLKTQ